MTGQRYAHAALQFLRYLSSPFRETGSLDQKLSLRQLAVDPVRCSTFQSSNVNTLISGFIKFEELDYVHIMELTGFLLRRSSYNKDLRKFCEGLMLLSQVEDGVQAMPREEFQDLYCGRQERPLLLLSSILVAQLKVSFYPQAPIPDHEFFCISFATELAGDIVEYVKVS